MSALYGSQFADMWRGLDVEEVKLRWAEELRGFKDQPERIKQAMEALRGQERVPNLPQFINMLRQTSTNTPLALPAPIDRDAAAQKMEEMVKPAIKQSTSKIDHIRWAKAPKLSAIALQNFLDLVEGGDYAFVEIFRQHRREGRLNDSRSKKIEEIFSSMRAGA